MYFHTLAILATEKSYNHGLVGFVAYTVVGNKELVDFVISNRVRDVGLESYLLNNRVLRVVPDIKGVPKSLPKHPVNWISELEYSSGAGQRMIKAIFPNFKLYAERPIYSFGGKCQTHRMLAPIQEKIGCSFSEFFGVLGLFPDHKKLFSTPKVEHVIYGCFADIRMVMGKHPIQSFKKELTGFIDKFKRQVKTFHIILPVSYDLKKTKTVPREKILSYKTAVEAVVKGTSIHVIDLEQMGLEPETDVEDLNHYKPKVFELISRKIAPDIAPYQALRDGKYAEAVKLFRAIPEADYQHHPHLEADLAEALSHIEK